MTINKNIRYYRKITEKSRGIPSKFLVSHLLVSLSYRTWFRSDAKTHSIYPFVKSESNLILIFMIIKENIRYHRKITVKLWGYTYKITNISAADCHREANMVPK